MADRLRWGILATGSIAHAFARGIENSRTGELFGVGSRTLDAATRFAGEHGGRPYGSYDALLADPEIDAIYIATPHHMHEEWTIKAAEAGKGILCEKPFTLNAIGARRALAAVEKAGVFFMEAFMYRCHPQTHKIVELVSQGKLGAISSIAAEFGYSSKRDWDNFRLDGSVGGGALMDVGTYCVSMCRLIAREEPRSVAYLARIGARGYDEVGAGSMLFPSGVTAHFGTAVHQQLENKVRIYGSEGMLEIDDPWRCEGAMRLIQEGQAMQEWSLGTTREQLYAHEADAVAEFWEDRQCPFMTIADTLGNMETLDRMRESAALYFACESKA